MASLLEDFNNGSLAGRHKDDDIEKIIITKYVSDRALYIVLIVVMVTLSGVISILGILTNAVNIIVFIRQGILAESSNISLLGLSIADLMCVLSMTWTSISYAMALHKPPDISWEPYDILYISGAWPRVISGLITRLITTFVALERCVCVVFPFKVKSIFTPKSSCVSIVCIFAYSFITYSPVYYYNQLRYSVNTNGTSLRLVTLAGFTHYEAVVSYINLFSLNFGSVAVVLICTMITVSRVKMSRAWRESCAASGNDTKIKTEQTKQQLPGNEKTKTMEGVAEGGRGNEEGGGGNAVQPNQMSASRMRKEKRLINMISFISIIFLLCYVPNMTVTIMYGINDQINTKGDYQNLAWTMFSIIFLSETINSSINIFIYYKMSSKFKQECNRLLGVGVEQ